MTSTILFRLSRSRSSMLAGIVALLVLLSGATDCRADQPAAPHPVVELWPGGAPGAKGTDPDKDVPSITVWLPREDPPPAQPWWSAPAAATACSPSNTKENRSPSG